MLYGITIMGEVSQFKVYGPHAYFTLKDKNAEISCTCFNYLKTYKPNCGESILVTGSPNFYVKKGTLTFNVESVKPVGQGLLYLRLEELKNKLREEGLFDESKKKKIPEFPADICVVTSINGAVIRDIVTTVRLKNDIINIKVYDVRVQGEGAAKTIVKALKDVDNLGFDLIILARGGGSLEDLMPFNDEEVARTIFNLKTPIISAVGHETDFTLADFTADSRAATPTAAAEMIAYSVEEWRKCILKSAEKLYLSIFNKYKNYESEVKNNINLLNYQSELLIERNCTAIFNLMKRCQDGIEKIYSEKAHKIDNLITALDANSPVKLLKSGYFRIRKDDTPIYSIKQLKAGDEITATGGDGSLKVKVLEIEENKNEI